MPQLSQTNRLLGYPDDARLLLLNADDLGLCASTNAAILRTLEHGLIGSTSLMLPCPGTAQAVQLLHERPEIVCGIHLTVVCDTIQNRFGPLSPPERVGSLLDERGAFPSFQRMAELLARARLDELEAEFRTQIEAALAAQLRPTHLDWHCLRLRGRADIFELMLRLAIEYGLALRAIEPWQIEIVRSHGLPGVDHPMLDSFLLDIATKPARYQQLLHELPAGLSEWAIHPGLDSAELQAIQPDGVQQRQTDLDFWTSQAAREIIQAEGILLLDYRRLQAAWRGAGA